MICISDGNSGNVLGVIRRLLFRNTLEPPHAEYFPPMGFQHTNPLRSGSGSVLAVPGRNVWDIRWMLWLSFRGVTADGDGSGIVVHELVPRNWGIGSQHGDACVHLQALSTYGIIRMDGCRVNDQLECPFVKLAAALTVMKIFAHIFPAVLSERRLFILSRTGYGN